MQMCRSVEAYKSVLTLCHCPGEAKKYCCQTFQRFHNGGDPCYLKKKKRNCVYFQCQMTDMTMEKTPPVNSSIKATPNIKTHIVLIKNSLKAALNQRML